MHLFTIRIGMYKYIANGSPQSIFSFNENIGIVQTEAMKLNKLQSECSLPHTINRGEHGGILNGWRLQGVLLVIRHGDRGPMTHVRGINSIDCSPDNRNSILMNKYRNFLLNTTTNAPAGHYIWNKSGPFHNFPLLPAFPKSCLLGQLTYTGIAQLLQVGESMRQVYAGSLGFLNKVVHKAPNTTMSSYVSEEIIIYSTRYRRTFQSAMALMFAFINPDRWLSLQVQESFSLTFCFSDCTCSRADQLKNHISKEFLKRFTQHQIAGAVVHWIGSNVLQNPTPKMQPMEVRDAILSIICHNAPLPCRRNGRVVFRSVIEEEKIASTSITADESNDLINIDQDDNTVAASGNTISGGIPIPKDSDNEIVDPEDEVAEEIDGCVETSHIEELMSYTQWQGVNEAKHKLTRQQGLLRAYGLMRSIVGFMLKIISGDKTKFVLYSGHDRTMQFLISALGLNTEALNQSYHIPYASRMAFEIYKSESGNGDLSEYFFRVVSNGRDVTRLIEFCEGGRSLRIVKDSRGNKADLCPVENIIRFIHDDYFSTLNATNFKDACNPIKNSEF